MKKVLALLLAVMMVACIFASCGASKAEDTTAADTTVADTTVANDEKTVMTYAEYVAADLDTEVTVETYVQAKESWWDNKATVYTQDKDGAYFLYELPVSEDDYALLVPGVKLQVTGTKSAWSGEVEIIDATYTIVDDGDTYIAEATDVTAALDSEDLINYINQFVSVKDAKVVASKDADGNEVPYLFNWDGSGADGDDVYFNIEVAEGKTHTFNIRKYLCDSSTEVYAAAKNLKVGDTIDLEGFLYWYEADAQARITSITVK